MATTRVGDIKLLNQQRWEQHLAAQTLKEQLGARPRPAGAQPIAAASAHCAGAAALATAPWGVTAPAHAAVPTAGSLFNRPNPIAYDHERDGREYYTNPYNRKLDRFLMRRGEKRAIRPDGTYVLNYNEADAEQAGQMNERMWDRDNTKHRFMPVYGSDLTSVNEADPRKFRIPNTSVVNKVGDLKVPFCCWGIRLTAAQWVWWTNLLCFCAHMFMFVFTLERAFLRWGRNPFNDPAEHVRVKIYRISQIPTPEMLALNESRWSPGWNLTNPRASVENEFYLHDNDLSVDFAWLTASFFLISALFHLWALIAGLFERYWFIYWRQMDDAFCWWRWAEYSVSASLMAMAIAISIGLREQSVLAGIFMLHWCTMAFGFLVEYIAVPKYLVDTTPHYRPVGAYEFGLWERGLPPPTPIDRYRNDPKALKLISQDQWQLDRPLYDIQSTNTIVGAESDYFVQAQRRQNFFRRMIPHIFGWFSCSAAWVIIIVHLEWARHDLRKVTDRTIPEWVDGAIYGTVIIFWSFTFVQIIFQYLPPGFYWGSELIYCVLSLSAKMYLGFFLLINVILTDGTVEASLAPAQGGTDMTEL